MQLNRPASFLLLLLWMSGGIHAQEKAPSTLHISLAQSAVGECQSDLQARHRKLLNLRDANWKTKFNPLTYLAVGLMYTYQNVVSEQISAECNYEISCSEMTKKSIEAYGIVKGTLIGLHQLTNCFPGMKYEHCNHALSANNKIINAVHE